MDQHKKQNNPIFSQINSSNKALQLLLSLSVLAIIASQYSSLLSYSIKLLSYSTTDRHYIFLVCNGLMLLVIKTSGLFASPTPPGTDFYRNSHVIRHHVQASHHQFADFHEKIHVKNNVVFNQFTESDDKKNVGLQSDDLPEAKAETNAKVVTEVEEAKIGKTEMVHGECATSTAECDEKEVINDLLDHVDERRYKEEEEEEEGIMLWSTEELNKKCDDFIRKMKYRIKNEAPFVMV